MPEISDAHMFTLIRRLRHTPLYDGSGEASELGEDAADALIHWIARLRAAEAERDRLHYAIAKLHEAAKPFARPPAPDGTAMTMWDDIGPIEAERDKLWALIVEVPELIVSSSAQAAPRRCEHLSDVVQITGCEGVDYPRSSRGAASGERG